MENIPPLIYDDSSTIHLERIPGESLPIDRLYTEDEGVLIETHGLDVTGTIEFLFRIDGVEGFSELLGKPLCDPENESVICYLNYDPATRSVLDHIDLYECAVTGRTMQLDLTDDERQALKPILEAASLEYNKIGLDDPAWFEPETEEERAIADAVKASVGKMEFSDEVMEEPGALIFHSRIEEVPAAVFATYMAEKRAWSEFVAVNVEDAQGGARHFNIYLDEGEREALLERVDGFCRERYGMGVHDLGKDVAAKPDHGAGVHALEPAPDLEQIATDAARACDMAQETPRGEAPATDWPGL